MRRIFLFAVLLSVFTGCIKSTGDKCDYNECGIVAPANEIQAVQTYINSLGITTAVQHCSGLFYVIDNPGTGKAPDACSAIDVDHTGTLTDGTVFSQGVFQTEMGFLIPGWRNGLPKIKEGGRIRLFIPPKLGYGPNPNGNIPGNSILVFSVDLNTVF